MLNVRIIILLTIAIFLNACKDTNSSESDPQENNTLAVSDKPEDNSNTTLSKNKTMLYAWVDKLRLRKSSSSSSEVIKELAEGEALEYLNEKSDFTQKVNLRGTLYDEPWLKVHAETGEIGWVFGGGVKPYKNPIDAAPSPYDACEKLLRNGQPEKYYACKKRIMAKQLKKDDRYVEVIDKGYRFKLLDGEMLDLSQAMVDEELAYNEYLYRYYIPRMGYFVVEVVLQEGGEYLLINDKSGKKTTVWGYPKPAPDNKHMVVTSADLEAGFLNNGIQILGFTQNGLEVIWEKELRDYKPLTPKWLDAGTIELTLKPSETDNEKASKLVALKMDQNGNWVLGTDAN